MYGLTLFALVLIVVQSTYTQDPSDLRRPSFLNSNEFISPRYRSQDKFYQRFREEDEFSRIFGEDEKRRRIADEDKTSPRFNNEDEISPRFEDEEKGPTFLEAAEFDTRISPTLRDEQELGKRFEGKEEISPRFEGEEEIRFEGEEKVRPRSEAKDEIGPSFKSEEEISPRFKGEDPIVGFGLGFPITKALTHQTRAMARLNTWVLRNKLEANKFKHNLRRVAARPFYPNSLLRFRRETPINQQDDWITKTPSDEKLETPITRRAKRQDDWMRMKGPNMKRDEELFVYSLHYPGFFRVAELPADFTQNWDASGNPEISQEFVFDPNSNLGDELSVMNNEFEQNFDKINTNNQESFLQEAQTMPNFQQTFREPNQFSNSRDIFRINEEASNFEPFREAEVSNNFGPFREAMPEPHFHYIHKIISHYKQKYGPSQVTINNQHTSINNFQSDSPHHGVDQSHGSSAYSQANNFGHSKNLQPTPFASFENGGSATINNQANTISTPTGGGYGNGDHSKNLQPTPFASFENAGSVTINNQNNQISAPTGGNIQIGQTTGNAASSQASGASHSGNIQISQTTSNAASSQANHIVSSPYIIHVPYNRKRYRRSLPLVRLVVDPNAKLDMPKTLQNVGTIARKSFEDQRAPMYHVRNVVGSLKNAFLSTLKIAPQDLIIPSQYKIVDAKEVSVASSPEIVAAPVEGKAKSFKERLFQRIKPKNNIDEVQLKRAAYAAKVEPRLGAEAPSEDPYNFLGTFQKIGAIFRDSVRSSHQVVQHISDAAHSARKAYTTSKLSAPRVLLHYSRAPVLQKPPNKLTMISPRFLDVNDNDANDALRKDDEMVKVGDLMDAFGLSHPEGDRVGLRRITIQKDPALPLLQSRFGDIKDNSEYFIIGEDIDESDLGTNFDDAWKSLEGIKSAVGVNTVKGFLQEMKQDFKRVREKVRGEREATQNGDDELSNFFKNLFARTPQAFKKPPNINSRFQDESESLNDEEIATETSKENAAAKQDLKDEDSGRFKGARRFKNFMAERSKDEEASSGKFVEETVPAEDKETVRPIDQTEAAATFENGEIVGAKLLLPENLWHPFMNQPTRNEVESYFRDNGDDLEGFERAKNFAKDAQDVARKNVRNFQKLDDENEEKNMEEEQRARIKFHDKLLKPYMGKIKLKHFDRDDYGYPFGEVYDHEYYH